jgi:predicted nucleotidyltransferase
MNNKAGIELRGEWLTGFCRRHHIRRLAVFGSVLRDDFGPDSDIDVLVEFEPGRTPGLTFFDMEIELGERFGRPVDLNTAGFLGPEIGKRVEPELEVCYDET